MLSGTPLFLHTAFSSVSRLLPPKGFILHSVSFIQYLCVDFFPALILRWLGLICMHLHNESHLHAQGRLYHENRHEKVCVCVRMPDRAYALTCWCIYTLLPSSFHFHSRTDQPSLMPGNGKSEGCEAVVLMVLLLPSPSLLACPLPPVTRCSLHKATILEHAGIKWKWKISRYDPPSLSCVSHPPLSPLLFYTRCPLSLPLLEGTVHYSRCVC